MTLAVLLLVFAPTHATADVFYMLNQDKFEANVLEEQADAFLVRKEGESYSILFKHHRIEKKDIFTVINEKGDIIFPRVLERPRFIKGFATELTIENLSDSQYLNYFIRQTYEEQKKLSHSVNDIRNIMLLQLVLVLGVGIVAAFAQ